MKNNIDLDNNGKIETIIGLTKRIKQLEEELKDIKNADKRFLQLSSRGNRIKQLEDENLNLENRDEVDAQNFGSEQMCKALLNKIENKKYEGKFGSARANKIVELFKQLKNEIVEWKKKYIAVCEKKDLMEEKNKKLQEFAYKLYKNSNTDEK